MFTPDIAHFINGQSYLVEDSTGMKKEQTDNFTHFQNLCCAGYNCVRKYGHKLINIFLIMLSAGIPELTSEQDIEFLRNRLSMNQTDDEASEKFKQEIDVALDTFYRRIDNMFHNIRVKK